MSAPALGPDHPFISQQARHRFFANYERLAAEWPSTWEAWTVETELGLTAIRSSGPVEAPQLVLLPGAGGDFVQWPIPLLEALSSTYRVHAVDNIEDFGCSVCSRPIRTTSDRMSWLDQLLDELSPDAPVILAGGSRGAWLSAEYALHAPHRLVAAIWMSPALVTTGWSPGAMRFISFSLRAMRQPSRESVGEMLRWILPRYATEHPSEFQRFFVDHTVVCFQCFDLSVVGKGWGPRKFRRKELAAIKIPVLCMSGADERLGSSRAGASRLRRLAPNIQTRILPGAGHDMIWVRTSEVSRRILEFLESPSRLPG